MIMEDNWSYRYMLARETKLLSMGLFQLPINLEKYCCVTISGRIWQKLDIAKDLENILQSVSESSSELKFPPAFQNEQWWKVTERVLSQVESLNLPTKLNIKLSEFIIFMGGKIYSLFTELIDVGVKFNRKLFQKIFFTNHGLVNKRKIFYEWKKNSCFSDFHDNESQSKIIASALACVHRDWDYLQESSLENMEKLIKKELGLNLELRNWNMVVAVLLIWYMGSTCSTWDHDVFTRLSSSLKENLKYRDGEDKMLKYCLCYGYEKAADYFYKKLDEVDQEIMVLAAAERCLNSFVCFHSHGNTDASLIQDNSAETAMLIINHDFLRYMPEIPEEKLEKMAGTILYVMRKISENDERKVEVRYQDQKKFLIEHIRDIITIFLNTWPYQYLCINLLDHVWNDLPRWKKRCILETCFLQLCEFPSLRHHDVFRTIHQQILEFVFHKIPSDLKVEVFTSTNSNDCDYRLITVPFIGTRLGLFDLYKKSHFSTMKMIVNDKDLLQYRERLIDITGDLTEYIHLEKDFEVVKIKIETFMEELEFSSSEKENFLKKISGLTLSESLVLRGCFSVLDPMIEWICGSDTRKIAEKSNQIREILFPIDVYSYFVEEENFTLSEIYLQWHYAGRDEELKNFKKIVYSNEFICETFWFKWVKAFFTNNFSTSIAKTEGSEVLTHYLKSRFKINLFEKGINEKCVKHFCDSFLRIRGDKFTRKAYRNYASRLPEELDHYDADRTTKWIEMCGSNNFEIALNEALDFCSVSTDKIAEIKRIIRNNIDWWLDFYGNDAFQFAVLHNLINWIGFEVEEKFIVCRKFIESKKGASLCVTTFAPRVYGAWNVARRILVFWIKEYGDVNVIKRQIWKLECSRDEVSRAMDYLDMIIRFDL